MRLLVPRHQSGPDEEKRKERCGLRARHSIAIHASLWLWHWKGRALERACSGPALTTLLTVLCVFLFLVSGIRPRQSGCSEGSGLQLGTS